MKQLSRIALGAAALVALAACTPRMPAPEPQTATVSPPAAPAVDLAQTLRAPAFPPLPAADCRGPSEGTVTLARGETKEDGSVRFFFAGRDHSYRTPPSIYILETNAALLNSQGAPRGGTTFGLWRGRTQAMEACGQRYALVFTSATENRATFRIRRV